MRFPELLQICLFLGECAYFSWERHSAHWHEHASSTLKHASWSQTESREASHKNGLKRMKWLNKGIPMHLRPYHPFCRVFQVLRKTGNWVTFFRHPLRLSYFSHFFSCHCVYTVLILRLFFVGILFISHRCPFLLCDHVIGRVHFKSLPH